MRKFVALFLLCGLASLASAQSDTAAPTIEQVEAQIKQAEQAAARGVDTVQAGAPRFKDVGDAFIVDRQTGLAWTQADNGADTNWDDAQRWCKSKGTQLPNMVELGGLFDSALRRVSCGDNKCQVSALFKLTDSRIWSAEQQNSSEVNIFDLEHGFRSSKRFESTKGMRALCIKRSTAAQDIDKLQAGAPRFEEVGDAFIVDRQTGLTWTQADNGADTNWDDAQSWCKSKGTQLPNMVELGGLFDSALRRVSCGDNKCQVSALFQLTGSWFWSAEQENSSEAKIFGFQNGFRVSNRFESTKGKRALCVKRSHLKPKGLASFSPGLATATLGSGNIDLNRNAVLSNNWIHSAATPMGLKFQHLSFPG